MPDLRLGEMDVRSGQALAASLAAGLRHAEVPAVLRMLDETRPPPKRFRRRYGRRIAEVTAYAEINAPDFFDLQRELQSIALYDVRNRLPAVLTAYGLVTKHGMSTSRVFHNGLLSDYAISAILSVVVSASDTGKQHEHAETLSRQKTRGRMNNPTTGTATSHFIAGVNMPVLPAEDDIVVWFNKNYERAAKDAHLEVDDSENIDRLLKEGERMIASLRP